MLNMKKYIFLSCYRVLVDVNTPSIGANREINTQQHPWSGSIWEKQQNHTCGFAKLKKWRPTTPVVLFKLKKGRRPHLWFASKSKKEANHTCGRVQNG